MQTPSRGTNAQTKFENAIGRDDAQQAENKNFPNSSRRTLGLNEHRERRDFEICGYPESEQLHPERIDKQYQQQQHFLP
jgi:hypothetical protein